MLPEMTWNAFAVFPPTICTLMLSAKFDGKDGVLVYDVLVGQAVTLSLPSYVILPSECGFSLTKV